MRGPSPTANDPAVGQWFGLDRIPIRSGDQQVEVTIGHYHHWDSDHLERLTLSSQCPGLVPVIHAQRLADGTPVAVSIATPGPTMGSLSFDTEHGWAVGAPVIEAAARILGGAHTVGLFHGALSVEDVCIIGSDVAVSGVGLGWGGYPHHKRRLLAAPEILSGELATASCDVFSLGLLLSSVVASSGGSAPKGLAELIEWATSAAPVDRPRSAIEFADALGHLLSSSLGNNRIRFGAAWFGLQDTNRVLPKAIAAASRHRQIPDDLEFVEPSVTGSLVENPTTTETPASSNLQWLAVIAAGCLLLVLLIWWASLSTTTSQPPQTSQTVAPPTPETATSATNTDAPRTQSTQASPPGPETIGHITDAAVPTPGGALGSIDADNAGLQFLHGGPEVNIDVYLGSQLLATSMGQGEIAGPINSLPASERELYVYLASKSGATAPTDRQIPPTATASGPKGASPRTFVLHTNRDGAISIAVFEEDFTPIAPGQTRLELRNLTDQVVSLAIDHTPAKAVGPGATGSIETSARTMLVELLSADGTVVDSNELNPSDGELVILTSTNSGSAETPQNFVQRFTGLESAPSSVPTGNSGLLASSDNSELVLSFALISSLAWLGAGIAAVNGRPAR